MGYLHIDNLYKSQDILLFKECYALEKIHGSSAHVAYKHGSLHLHGGGVSQVRFEAMFDSPAIKGQFEKLGHPKATIFGEVYGASCQGMSEVYGKTLRFIAFDVRIDEVWLAVPDMVDVVKGFGFDVVHYERCSTDLAVLDAQRDRPSVQAERNGCGIHPREGVVLRPLIELTKNNGERVIAKHRIEKFNERATPQKIIDPAKLEVLTRADDIAKEWVTPMRLSHVLDKIPGPYSMSQTPKVIEAMIEDVLREAKGEIVESKDATRAIGRRAAELFKAQVTTIRG